MTKKDIAAAKRSLRAWKREVITHIGDWDDPMRMLSDVQCLERYVAEMEATK